MKITIIGAGNTAVAAACFLKTLGLSSLIYTRREERAKQWNQFPVKASGAGKYDGSENCRALWRHSSRLHAGSRPRNGCF